jgi:hypothetical protein
MPDYRALAQALDPYAMDTGGITPDTIKALKTVNKSPNLLGMIADIGRGGLSNLESLVRGGVAQFGGTPVDTLNTIRTPYPMEVMGDVNYAPDKQVYGGTKDILGMMPKRVTQARPETAGMEELGTVMGPGLAKGVAPAVKGYASLLGNEVNAGMTGQPTRSIIGQITPKPLQLDVYHGSPHRFPPTERNPLGEFDASKIGTGEGAQSYGYGIYTAENPSVAREYLIENNWFDTSKATYKGKPIDYWYDKAQRDQDLAIRTNNKQLLEDSNVRLGYWENIMTHTPPEKVLKTVSDPDYGWDKATEYAKSIELDKFKGIPQSGAFYKADLPDEKIAKMLDYDLPLHQQPPEVQAAVEKLIGLKVDKTKLNEFDDALLNALQTDNTIIPKQPTNPMGYDLLRMLGKNDQEVARKLQELGVPGVRYFDAGSRDNMQGTRNFVIFPNEEKNVTILERQ